MLREEVAGIEAEAWRLERDRFAIERAIREELGFAGPGQSVVRLRGRTLSSPRNP